MPGTSTYNAVHVFTKEASQLYGAGTKWCTTVEDIEDFSKVHNYNPHDYQEMYPNLVYFLHKTQTIRDDPVHYKLALQIDELWHPSPLCYRYDAQNNAMDKEEFLQLLGIDSFDSVINFLRNFQRNNTVHA